MYSGERDTRWILISKAAALWLSIPLLTGVAQAQALRPYEPPSTRSRTYQQQQAPPSIESSAAREDFYERFRRDVQRMNQDVRTRLESRFRWELENARGGGRHDDVVHYERLLGILQASR